MRAITQDRYGGTEVLRLSEVPRPEPGPGQVLVRVAAAGVDRGVWHLMTGTPYAIRLAGPRRPANPVCGMDLAGTVEAVGAGVTGLAPGDEVYGSGSGSFAEYALSKPAKLARKPANLDFAHAAAVPTSGVTALHAVRQVGQVRAGQDVLVTGAGGGVGSFAVQLAVAAGARVTGVCSTAKVDLVRRLGAAEVIDYTGQDAFDGSRRYDVVIEIAGARPLRVLRRALAPGGTLVLVGGEDGDRVLGGSMLRWLKVAVLSPLVGQRLRGMLALTRTEDLEALTELIEAGAVTPALERSYPLEAAPEAIDRLAGGRALGKLVVTM